MVCDTDLVALQETLYTSSNVTRRWLHCTRRNWIFQSLRRYALPTHTRALEVGPGSGVYLPVLAKLFAEVFATDIEVAFLKHSTPLLKSHQNIHLVVDDITASALPPQSFDLILCTEVIEHIENSFEAILGMKRLLKPGGILILSTPQRYSPLELAAKIAFLPGVINIVRRIYGEPILETGHINLMTSREVEHQLNSAGFLVSERHKSGIYLPLIAEFSGESGLKLEKWLEKKLRGKLGDGLLWTQYYIAHTVNH
ncbi:Methyltransferase domain-containing protein [Polaromonas sp. OV174]|nr:Methyltransferase domain-containing protein [Polaromonas sp. OV174]